VNRCWTIWGCWSLVHACVAQTVCRVMWLCLIDIVIATHNHLSKPMLVACLRVRRGIRIICLLCIIDIDTTSIFTVIILDLHLLKRIWVLWWLKQLLVPLHSRLSLCLVVVVVLSSCRFAWFLWCSSRVICRISSWLANHETVFRYSLH
jgi:hypothetical protein